MVMLVGAVLLVGLATAWQLVPERPQAAAPDLRQQAIDLQLEMENRLRLADRALRAVATGLTAGGPDAIGPGESEQRYFHSLVYQQTGKLPVALLPAQGDIPPLDAAQRQEIAQGTTIVVVQPAGSNMAARVTLVRAPAPASAPADLLAAELSPRYLWATPAKPNAPQALCVRDAGGTNLFCSTPAAWQASSHLRGDLSQAIERLNWSAAGQSWQGAGATLTLASPRIAEHWNILSMAEPPPGATRTKDAVPMLPAALALLLGAWLASRLWARRRPGTSPAAAPMGASGNTAQPDTSARHQTGDATLQRRLERQRHAIRAMADIDRASLSRAGIDSLVELAGGHLLSCTGAQALTIVALEHDGLNRMTVTHTFADDVQTPVPQQQAIGESVQKMLAAPTDGGWVHALDDLAVLQPMAERGIGSVYVLPVHQDGQPAGLIVLGAPDAAQIGADEISNARAVTGRLGAALTSLAREQALYAQTHFDTVTTLPNRLYLKEHLPQQISRARRERARLALLFIDLDGFKMVNRVAGHSRGDLVLAEAASRIRKCLREEDLVTRFGGDEFVVVLPKVAAGLDARRAADKLLAALSRPYQVDGENHQLGSCIGISVFPDDAQTVDTLLRNADSALFDAKAAGRGRYAFFDAAVNRAAIDRSSLELELHRAIANQEFVVFYQPQIDLRTGQIDSAEALVRWNHPSRGLIGPYEFIAVAEQSGLIEQLGEQVMLAACRQLRQWDTRAHAPQRVSVNVSSLEVTRGDIVARIDRILNETGLRPMHLELELTEGVFLDEASGALDKLNQLRQRGVRIAIDDFGTGYSSLGYLRRLPIDVVKIDQSFVRDLSTNGDSSSIVRAVLDVAHALGKQVVAEGVETEAHRALLAEMGCDVAQGYLWARPLPAEQFEAFYSQRQTTVNARG